MSTSLSLQPLLRRPYKRETCQTILEDILPSASLQLHQLPHHYTPKALLTPSEARLQAEARFWISPALRQATLHAAGEIV